MPNVSVDIERRWIIAPAFMPGECGQRTTVGPLTGLADGMHAQCPRRERRGYYRLRRRRGVTAPGSTSYPAPAPMGRKISNYHLPYRFSNEAGCLGAFARSSKSTAARSCGVTVAATRPMSRDSTTTTFLLHASQYQRSAFSQEMNLLRTTRPPSASRTCRHQKTVIPAPVAAGP